MLNAGPDQPLRPTDHAYAFALHMCSHRARLDIANLSYRFDKDQLRAVLRQVHLAQRREFQIQRQPVIGLTLRLDRLDNFCFVLRHEIEHVFRGDGREEMFAPVDEFGSEIADIAKLVEDAEAKPAERRPYKKVA